MDDENTQLRHWFGTIWPGHILGNTREIDEEDKTAWMIGEAADLVESIPGIPGLKYAAWQCEHNPDEGEAAHIQIYLEFDRSLRRSQVSSRIAGHWERIKSTRTIARDYAIKAKGRLSPQRYEFGEFRKEGKGPSSENPKNKAIALLVEGATPAEICARFPSVYFTHHHAINKTWEMMQIAKTLRLQNEEEEEE